ncbi:MAG: hypothetical protein MUE41_09155 [Gemmatimonadaceae bacterium]|jgi:hypothetical protein|nr:hypothetical protein [Gemmatimonadaceae bacterium]
MVTLPAVASVLPTPGQARAEREPPGDRDGATGLRVRGAAIVYRLYDVGYEIHLDRALDLLATSAPERVRPVRGEGQALQIPNPPITLLLGQESVMVSGQPHDVDVSARIFDFGVVSLRVRVAADPDCPWPQYVAFGQAIESHPEVETIVSHHLRLLTERIKSAIERPAIADMREDYAVFRVTRIVDAQGVPVGAEALEALDVVPLLLNETRPLSAEARRELLPHRFSYYADDLAILTWENALVVEPALAESVDTDVQYILEFANAQLLELRFYDAQLDAELPRMYDRIAAMRGSGRAFGRRRFAPLLAELQARVADSTELVERADNALKVTDDVYLARVYSAALELFRGKAWRSGIDRKLGIIRDTYGMLNDEAQATRGELLEIAIVALILIEIVLSLVRH